MKSRTSEIWRYRLIDIIALLFDLLVKNIGKALISAGDIVVGLHLGINDTDLSQLA